MISIPQIRAARGLLGWSQIELARAAGLSEPTVKRAEGTGKPSASVEAVDRMRAALEAAGVVFIDEYGEGVGVRLRKERPADTGKRPEDLNSANDD